MRRLGSYAAILISAWIAVLTCAEAADPGFQKWLQEVWPQAQTLGVSRATFDAATRALEPDLTLPDLDLPGREGALPRGQAEFVQTPADYIKETTIANLAAQAKKLAVEHARTLAAIEQQFGVPGNILLAIWGRETAFGGYKLPKNAVTVLATVPLCAQDARRGARQARRDAQLLGRRHGPDPVPALRILQIRG